MAAPAMLRVVITKMKGRLFMGALSCVSSQRISNCNCQVCISDVIVVIETTILLNFYASTLAVEFPRCTDAQQPVWFTNRQLERTRLLNRQFGGLDASNLGVKRTWCRHWIGLIAWYPGGTHKAFSRFMATRNWSHVTQSYRIRL